MLYSSICKRKLEISLCRSSLYNKNSNSCTKICSQEKMCWSCSSTESTSLWSCITLQKLVKIGSSSRKQKFLSKLSTSKLGISSLRNISIMCAKMSMFWKCPKGACYWTSIGFSSVSWKLYFYISFVWPDFKPLEEKTTLAKSIQNYTKKLYSELWPKGYCGHACGEPQTVSPECQSRKPLFCNVF